MRGLRELFIQPEFIHVGNHPSLRWVWHKAVFGNELAAGDVCRRRRDFELFGDRYREQVMKNHKPKRGKAYRPRAMHMPMMAETHYALSFQLHAAVETLIHKPSAGAYNEMTKKIATMTDAVGHMRNSNDLSNDRDATANALRTAVMVLDDVRKRWERIEVVAVTNIEATSLRNACGILDATLKKIPKNVYDGCVMQVARDAHYRQKAE